MGESSNVPDAATWGLDPLYWAHVQLFTQQVHELGRDKKSMCEHCLYGRRPVSKAAVMGVVVGVERKSNKVLFLVDDGTSVLPCIEFHSGVDKAWMRRMAALTVRSSECVELGSMVRVEGTLRIDQSLQREQDPLCLTKSEGEPFVARKKHPKTRVLYIENIVLVDDPNVELLHWFQVMKLSEQVYVKEAPPTFQEAWDEHESTVLQAKYKIIAPSSRIEQEAIRALTSGFLDMASSSESPLQFEETIYIAKLLRLNYFWDRVAKYTKLPRRDLEGLLPPAFHALVADGTLFQTSGSQYIIISKELHIKPALVVILAKFGKSTGLEFAQISAALRQDPRLAQVRVEAISSCLSDLVQEGTVKLVGSQKFCLVT